MTNPLTYYTYTEISTYIVTLLIMVAILFVYNIYFLKKRAGVFLALTIFPPIVLGGLAHIFSDIMNINTLGYNSTNILWIPTFFTFAHTVFFITRLQEKKRVTDKDITFNFLKYIKTDGIALSGFYALTVIASLALLPIENVITLAVGLLIAVLSITINTVIIIKKL